MDSAPSSPGPFGGHGIEGYHVRLVHTSKVGQVKKEFIIVKNIMIHHKPKSWNIDVNSEN